MLSLWFAINLSQAIFTGILSDEAYYSLWGKHLAWGYFDHPPMVAVFCYISSLLFNGNIGVRFLTVLIQIGTLSLIWRIIDDKKADKKNVHLFFILAASLIMFEALGFTTTPDVPLLFFASLFLLSYKRFLRNENYLNSLLLCISMAGMVYSKYQSILVIGFVVLSNLRLLLRPKFWMAGMGALIFLSPHFCWQYKNNFPSFQYHLVDRNNQFQLKYFLEYLPNQLAVFNPLTFGLAVYALIKYKYKDVFEKGLYFLIIGFICFFWLMAYRGHVEPHWTAVCSIPMIIVLYKKANENISIRKFVNRYVFGSLALILLVRIVLFYPPLAVKFGFNDEDKYAAIESVASDLPVVFQSSFQPPSLYTFFSGKHSTTISSINNRRTQFDVWQFERNFEGKPVFVCANIEGLSKKYDFNGHFFYGFITDSFHSAMRLKVDFITLTKNEWQAGDSLKTNFTVFNPYPYIVEFNDKTFPVSLCACFITKKIKEVIPVVSSLNISSLKPSEKKSGRLYAIVPELPEGDYTFSININSIFGPSLEKGLDGKNYFQIKIVK